MKKCKVCGKSYIGDFCPKCGYLDSRDIICSECGKSYDPDLDTCPQCLHTVKRDEDLGEVSLTSNDDINRTKPYVKCVNVFTQKVVLSCIAFCLFFALFAMVFAGLIYITPKGGIVTYSVLSAVFASFLVAAVIIHAARIISTRRHGVKRLTDSCRLTSVYVFMGIIGTCLVCGCVFLITDAGGSVGKFPFYWFVAYSSVSLAAFLYSLYVRLSVKRLWAVLYTPSQLDIFINVRLRISKENLSESAYDYYLAYKRGKRNSKKGAYYDVSDDAADMSPAKAKAYKILKSKILYVALLSVVIVFVGMFFAIRGGNYLYTSRRLFGGYTFGADTECIEGLLDYDLDRYTKILGSPDMETDGAMYWYGDAEEGETCGFVMVTYEDAGGEKKVTSVYLDRDHVYGESDLLGTTGKTMEKLSLSQDTFSVHSFEFVPVDIVSVLEGDVAYVAEYSDGSFCVSYLTSFDSTSEGTGAYEVEWSDWMGSYSAKVSLTYRSFTNADGVLTSWYANDGLIDIPDWTICVADDALEGVTYINEVILPEGVTSLVIPSSVVRMGEGAFANCSSLESVTVKCASTFGNMFSGCDSLVSVDIAYGVEKIADCTFYNLSSLESVTIAESVTEIGDEAFRGCSYLTGIIIPSSVTIVGDGAFYKCTLLSDVSLSDGLSTISPYMLYGCSSLTTVVIPEGVTSIDVYAFYNCSSLTSVEIPNSVTSISAYAFCECMSLTTVIIPENVKSIGDFAFYGCTSLADVFNFSSLYIIARVSDYGYVSYYSDVVYTSEDKSENFYKASDDFEFFYDGETYSLTGYNGTSVYLTLPDSMDGESYEIGEKAFYNDTSVISVAMSDGVTKIGEYAFYACSSLNEVTVGENVTGIGAYAFRGCSGLVSIEIPNGVTTIGNYAFYGCTSLTEIYFNAEELSDFTSNNYVFYNGGSSGSGITVTIGTDVTEIPAYLFYPYGTAYSNYSPKITTVIFEDNSKCESMGSYAFYNCSSLTGVYITDLAAWCTTYFANSDANPVSYSKNLYVEGELLTDFTVPDGVTSVNSRTFYNCTSITSVTIPDFVTSIGTNAFYGCTSLEVINYYAEEMDDLSSSGAFASSGTSDPGITVTIGSDVAKIPAYLFYSVSNVTTVVFEDGSKCESIGASAFRGCSALGIIEIPSGVTTIGDYAFYGCTSIEIIYYNAEDLPDIGSNNYIFYNAGQNGSGITVTVGANVTKIPSNLFCPNNSSSYPKITILIFENNSKCTYMGNNAFYYCSSLTGVYITDLAAWCSIEFTTTTSNPLYYAGNLYLSGVLLSNMEIPDGVASISSYAFYNCTSITGVILPESLTYIGGSAFNGCVNLAEVYNYSDLDIVCGSTDNGRVAYYATIVYVNGEIVVDDYVFSYEDGVYFLTEYKGTDTDLVLPDSVFGNEYALGDGVFWGNSSITSVYIPDGVTSVGNYAFYGCSSLKSVTIGTGVTSIGHYAFYMCSAIKSVYISDLATWCGISFGSERYANPLYYGDLYLNGELVTDLVIPQDVTTISAYAFEYCMSVETVTIHDSVTSIGYYAFFACTSLTGVYITDLEAWCAIKFSSDANPLCYAGNLYLNGEIVVDLVIPDGVTSIGAYAFDVCTSIETVTVHAGVTTIGDGAFLRCSSLTAVYITDLAAWCGISFKNASSNPIYYGASLYLNGELMTELVIPDGVTSIGKYAFYGYTLLTSVTVPANVTSMGTGAFSGCTSLTGVYITDIVSWCSIKFGSIESNPLYYAENLYLNGELVTNLVIPDGVTSIGKYAFYGCTSITDVTVPASLTSIGTDAFEYCTFITGVYITDLAAWCMIEFADYVANPLYFAESLYLNGELVTDLVIPNGVTSIEKYVFLRCTSIESVIIPASLISVGLSAFYGCTSITGVYITDLAAWCTIEFADYIANPLYFAESLYLNGELVTDLVIPDSVTSIGDYSFYKCTSIISLTVHDSVTQIGTYAFYKCSSITSVIIGSGVTSFGTYAFSGCAPLSVYITDLTAWCSIYFPDSSSNPLHAAESLYLNGELVTDLIIPDGVTSIGYFAFYGCTFLTSVTFPASLTLLDEFSFQGCTSITGVYITDLAAWCSVKISSFGNSPLYYAGNLYLNGELVTELVIPDGVTSISSYAFSGCTSIKTVVIPISLISVDYRAFEDCTSITDVYYFGTAEDWTEVSISSTGNDSIKSATVYYYSEEEPEDDGNFWHYVNEEIVIWFKEGE